MLPNPEKQTRFDPNEPADKYYFSAFFNEAIRNAATVLKHTGRLINAKYPGNDSPEDEIDEDALSDAGILKIKKKEDFQRAFDIRAVLSRRFTLLEAFEGKSDRVKRHFYFLRTLLKLAKEYRNYYSHWHHKPITLADVLPKDAGEKFKLSDFKICLDKCFKYAAEEAKRRFEFSDEIEARFTTEVKKGKKITDRYALFDAEEKPLSDNSGVHFLLCLLLPRDRAHLYLSRIWGYKGTHEKELLATRQIFTLLCLKLPKTQLISEESEAALTLDLMAYLARCPKPLYDILDQSDKQRFITRPEKDELTPPTEMTRNLDRAYYFLARFIDTHSDFRAGFRVQLGKWRVADYKNGSVARHIDQKVYKFDQLGKIRREDADEIAREANTDAGKKQNADERIDLKTRLPNILTSKEADRKWVQYAPHYARHPHAFSINSEMEKGKPKIIIGKGTVKNHPADRIIQQAPDFVFPNRALPLIAMLLLLNEEHKNKNYPIEALLKRYCESVKDFLKEIEETDLSTGKAYDLEELENKAKAHDLKITWLPRKLIKALTDAQKPFADQIQHKLDAEIERTAEYGTFLECMKKIRSTEKEPDKRLKYQGEIAQLKGKYEYKSGVIAADFSRDIWQFTVRDKGKIKMPNASEYQSLQKKLAIYAVHRQELDAELKGLRFHERNPFYKALREKDGNAFFGKRVKAGPKERKDKDDCKPKYEAIQDAYQAYLEEKERQLKNVKRRLQADPEKWRDYYDEYLFALKLPVERNKAGELEYKDLREDAKLKCYLNNLRKALELNAGNTKNDKNTALGVPPGFFVDRFIHFCEKYEPDLKDGLDPLKPVKLIERYLEKTGEGTQRFYDLERVHTYEKQPGKPPIVIKGKANAIHKQVKPRIDSAKDAEKKLKEIIHREAAIRQAEEIELQKKKLKEIIHREAAIRHAQGMDRVLWLCAKKWLGQHLDLKETEDNAKETEHKVPKLSDYAAGYGEAEGNNILDKTYTFNIQHLQDGHTFGIVVKTKLRDIGKVHALLRDKRLSTLFKLLAYPADQADPAERKKTFKLKYAELVEELENYEKRRMDSLECIQKFEEKHAPDREEGERYVSFAKTLGKNIQWGRTKYKLCTALRNSWMHNEYPWEWEEKEVGRKEKRQQLLFDIDEDLRARYLKYCDGLFMDQDNSITLHRIEEYSPARFWYEQTQRFFKVE